MYYVMIRLQGMQSSLSSTSGSWRLTHDIQTLHMETPNSFVATIIVIHECAPSISFSLMRISFSAMIRVLFSHLEIYDLSLWAFPQKMSI